MLRPALYGFVRKTLPKKLYTNYNNNKIYNTIYLFIYY